MSRSNEMSVSELEEIKKRCDQASLGPWKSMVEGRDHTSGSHFIMTGTPENRGQDIELLGATVNDRNLSRMPGKIFLDY